MLSEAHPLRLVLGLIIWSIWFVLVYTILSLGCEVAPPTGFHTITWLNISLFIFTVITLILLFYLTANSWTIVQRYSDQTESPKGFVVWVSLAVNLFAIIATFSIGVMVLFFPACL